MANIKSQIKRNRQNDKKRLRNRVYRGEARIAVKNARTNIDDGAPESKAALMQAISTLDKAAEQGVLHKNNAARRKSRLMKAFAKMLPVQVQAAPIAGETTLEVEPLIKKASPRKIAARKVEEPKMEAAAEAKDESKASSPKAKKTATKKPVVASPPKGKKADSKKSETKTTTKKKPTAKK
ncbi:MAG TPA: 30S ribosomal protein S20 [Anaerolineales bacterium]